MKNVAIVGCGNISDIYLRNLTDMFDNVTVYAVCDLDETKAKAKAERYHIHRIMTFEEILADPQVDIVLNITTPAGHYPLCKQAILAKKSVYVEKPLSLTYAQGAELVALAAENGVLLGCAPDTFMGAGLQTCRKLLDDGVIGDVIGATAFMVCHGHESWHPDPAFYYQVGGGPMFDMGPYYLTALVHLLGSVTAVSGMTAIGNPTRTITSQPRNGEVIQVEVPTHVNGLLRFENGAIGNIITSFDVFGSSLSNIEIHGTKGSMQIPDPNGFGGEVRIKRQGEGGFTAYPLTHNHEENSRGYGVSDMAACLEEGRTDLRASGQMALHVLEIMESIHVSSDTHTEIALQTHCSRPAALAGK